VQGACGIEGEMSARTASMIRLGSCFALLTLAACTNTLSPAPVKGRTTLQPDSIYFWKVNTSTLQWGACSDAKDFRDSVSALPIGMNSFLIYKTNADAKQARTQSCKALDPSTCTDSSTGVVFDVAGTELVFTRPAIKEALRVRDITGVERDSKCQLSQLETWTMRDQGSTFELEVTNALGMEDTTPPSGECDQIETSLIGRSPNMGGIRGCIITFTLSGELK